MDNKFFEILLPEYLIIKRKIRVLSLFSYFGSGTILDRKKRVRGIP